MCSLSVLCFSIHQAVVSKVKLQKFQSKLFINSKVCLVVQSSLATVWCMGFCPLENSHRGAELYQPFPSKRSGHLKKRAWKVPSGTSYCRLDLAWAWAGASGETSTFQDTGSMWCVFARKHVTDSNEDNSLALPNSCVWGGLWVLHLLVCA